jgi:hypothetical protein
MLQEQQVPAFLADLKRADLVDISYANGKGMLCGNLFPLCPEVVAVEVDTEEQAWAVNRAKEAITNGDETAAREQRSSRTNRPNHRGGTIPHGPLSNYVCGVDAVSRRAGRAVAHAVASRAPG